MSAPHEPPWHLRASREPPRLLVLRALGLGDLLTAVPALRALGRAFGEHRRILAAPRELRPLLALIGPHASRVPERAERAIDALVGMPAWVGPKATPRQGIGSRLPDVEVAVNLHGRGPESHRLLLATRPQELIAFQHPDVPESAGGPPWPARTHETQRWCALLNNAGIGADPEDIELPPPVQAGQRSADGPTLLHPGAGSPSRRWPARRWATVARRERQRGRRVLISGSARERPLALWIAHLAGIPSAAVLAGKLDLGGLAATVAAAGRVVCADTGIAHLATALRVPSVVIFGPTDPAQWGPPPARPWHQVLWTGRLGDPHAGRPDGGLLEIDSAQVLAALARLPEPPPRPTAGAAPPPEPREPSPHARRRASMEQLGA